ncbi:MAG: V-type ATP synthase subunit E [Candidatus Acetothermia bacterium]|jgi:V/A-type H+-transporting ATPase subunit E|nr:V-type ATP synthase subunit E [Candidatus Acetothermia bacterium]MDH7505752.1 V-type ATP synthase subunit E [Candidatus Acetothermia bacterium]
MGVDKIVAKLIADAEAEAARILEEAEREAKEILKRAEEEAQAASEPILQAAEKEAQRRRRRHLALAELEARNKVLAAKREVLDRVFAEAGERLGRLGTQEYRAFLRELLVRAAETGEEEILLSPRDAAVCDTNLLEEVNALLKRAGKAGSLKVAQEGRELDGGFVLRGQGYEVNVTFATLLRQAKEGLEAAVARLLFG